VLLVDLVESVRLMQEHEDYTVRRWAEFVRIVDTQILPRYDGVMVKSLGDGLLTRFETVPDAVNAAAEMHRTLATQNAALPEDQHFHLRAGVNAAMAWSNGIDYYGTGVNLAARLANWPARARLSQAHRRMSNWLPRWRPLRNRAKRSAAPQHATSLRTGWMRYAKTSATAFSNTSTSRFGPTASAPRAQSRVPSSVPALEHQWSRRSP